MRDIKKFLVGNTFLVTIDTMENNSLIEILDIHGELLHGIKTVYYKTIATGNVLNKVTVSQFTLESDFAKYLKPMTKYEYVEKEIEERIKTGITEYYCIYMIDKIYKGYCELSDEDKTKLITYLAEIITTLY